MSTLRTQFSKREMKFIWDTLDVIYDDLYDRNAVDFQHRTVDRLGELDDVFKLIAGEADYAEITGHTDVNEEAQS